MAIEFSCDCGKLIRVAEQFAGRRAKCPACGRPLTIPQPEPSVDEIDGDLLYEAIGGTPDDPVPQEQVTCPNCQHKMSPNDVICSHCGYNRIAKAHVQLAQAEQDANKKKKREPGAPVFSLAGMDFGIVKLVIVLALIIGPPTWYFMGPGKSMHILDMQVVNSVSVISSGDVGKPISTGGSAVIQMVKQVNKDKTPPPLDEAGDAVYSIGGSDGLTVSAPDDDGDHILLRVSLRQQTIRDKGSTSLYDSIIKGSDFKLEPTDGSPGIDGAKFLYHEFENGRIELSLAMADTSSYKAMFPSEPTQIDVDREYGTVSGKAYWNQADARGEVEFTSYYATGDMPAIKGLNGEGRIEVFNGQDDTVDMYYKGTDLEVSWDPNSSGWWAMSRYKQPSSDWPWYRYEFSLLFERPQTAGYYHVTYRGSKLGKIFLEEKKQPKPPPLSPIKTAAGQGQSAGGSGNPNPLDYFTLLAQAQKQAQGIVSASNLRQIGIGLQMYLEQNKEWPDRLDQIKTIIDGYDALMVNPRTKTRPGFIYIKPEPGADPATTAVVFENWQGQPDPNGAVLYADGHIE